MPIYEYECKHCRTIFETIVSMTSDEAVVCEKCGSKEIRKLISAASGIKITSSSNTTSSCQPRGGFT